jgi:hypothetical protein
MNEVDKILNEIKEKEGERNDPSYCPVCNGNNINYGELEAEFDRVHSECSCNDCGSSWMDEYFITSYCNLKKGKKSS